MIKYILLTIVQVSGGDAVHTHDFSTLESCQVAKQLIENQINNVTEEGTAEGYRLYCLPDGDESLLRTFKIKEASDLSGNVALPTDDDLPILKSNDNLPTH